MRSQLLAGVRALVALTLITGVGYPLVVLGVGQLVFSAEADGSLVEHDGRVVGSALLAQSFTGEQWFHPRPSAAGAASRGAPTADVGDPSQRGSGASQLGPTNPDLLAAVEDRVAAYRRLNGLAADAAVPVDAVTASASGLDPHISLANARLQAARVADTRALALDEVLDMVDAAVTGRSLGVLGEPGVDVLALNLALERAA